MGGLLGFLPGLLQGLLHLGDKMIPDQDKKIEFAFKVQQMANDLATKLLDTKTYPWVDALVKLAYASQELITGLFRPIGGLLALGYVLYANQHGIVIPNDIQMVLVSLFPAWGISRHIEKNKKVGPPDASY